METQQQQGAPPTDGLVAWRSKTAVGLPKTGVFVFVGHPKGGKTSLAASFPGSYVFEFEIGGADHIDGRVHEIKDTIGEDGKIVVLKAGETEIAQTALVNFRRTFLLAIKDPSVETVVVDTIDVLAGLVAVDVAQEFGLADMSEKKKGVNGFDVWGTYNQRMTTMVERFEQCGKRVILNAHCKNPEKDEQGNVLVPAGINVQGKQVGPLIGARAKLIGHCYKEQLGDETEYYVSFRGGPLAIWGSRVDELNDKVLRLPKERPYAAIEAACAAAPAKTQEQPAAAAPAAPAAEGKAEDKPGEAKAPPKPRARATAAAAGR